MNTSPTISLLLLLPLLFLLAAATTDVDIDLVDEICRESSVKDPINIDFTFCVTSFESTPDSQGASLDLLGLISVTLVKTNVTNTKNLIQDLLESENVDSRTKIGLSDCLELYSDSIDTLDEATEAYRAKRFRDANVKMSSVMDSSSTCENGFQDIQVVSPLTQQNRQAFQLCAIALSIMKMQAQSTFIL